MMKRSQGCVLVLILATAAQARADDDKAAIQAKTDEVNAKAEEVAKSCGGKLAAVVDWAALTPHLHDALADNNDIMNSCNKPEGLQAAECAIGPCKIVLDTLNSLCSSTYGEIGKGAVSRLTTVRCTYDASTKRDLALRLDGTTLEVKGNGLVKDTGFSQDWLLHHLPAPAKTGLPPVSVGERVKIDERDAQMAELGAEATKTCGVTIAGAVDWAVFVPHFYDASTDEICNKPDTAQATTCAQSACAQALSAIASACRTETTKKAVAAKVHSVRCIRDTKLPDRKLGIDLKGGVLLLRYDNQVRNVEEQVRAYLTKLR
jgi:hypothetical protein